MMFEKYDAYKDSGVEWLGQLPENWDLLPNKHIFKLKKNLVGKRSKEYELLSLTLNGVIKRDMENPEGKFPAEFDTYQEVKSGDFIFCHFDVEETPRTVGLSRFDGMITGAYTVYQINAEKFCPEFLYYFYLNLDTGKRLKPLYKGLRNTIGKDIFGEFKTFIPNYSEQVKISNFLDQKTIEIDQAIAIKEQQIALLNERKKIVIQKAVTQGLDPNVQMKDSGVEWIGEIPEHWEILPLTKYSTRVDYRGKTPEKVEEGRLLVTTRNIKNGILDYEISKEYIKESQYKEVMSRGIPKKGDILFTMEAPLGHSAVVDREDIAIAQRIIKFRLDSERLNSYFINYYFQTDIFQNYLYGLGTGSTALGIKASKLGLLKLIAPNLYEQEKIVAFLITEEDKFNSAFELLNQEISKLKEYKTTLINDAVTGKIKVA
ncbi:restriction endonuclease subunit S [Acinetobacter johnsonii]|uniref:restriction endonuclease subunit S n=1 Tax=Acinetobacter johnsonii TaxID=40214 RepID=UPI000262474E|nr:restriction endonuclease subunit S [Acinetobacter johnsonii]